MTRYVYAVKKDGEVIQQITVESATVTQAGDQAKSQLRRDGVTFDTLFPLTWEGN